MTESQLIGLGGAIGIGGRHLIGRLFAGMLGLTFARSVVLTNLVGPVLLVILAAAIGCLTAGGVGLGIARAMP